MTSNQITKKTERAKKRKKRRKRLPKKGHAKRPLGLQSRKISKQQPLLAQTSVGHRQLFTSQVHFHQTSFRSLHGKLFICRNKLSQTSQTLNRLGDCSQLTTTPSCNTSGMICLRTIVLERTSENISSDSHFNPKKTFPRLRKSSARYLRKN